MIHQIDSARLTLSTIKHLMVENAELSLTEEIKATISKSRTYLEERIASSTKPIYGINTGFGALCKKAIEPHQLEELQTNLVRSHACGVGVPVGVEIGRLMLLLKIHALSFGNSGVRLELVERLLLFYNKGIVPIVYSQGSLGASGDLVPLAHLSLPLMGEGQVYFEGQVLDSIDVLRMLDIEPLTFAAKEGLAMLNGTQFMAALLVVACLEFEELFEQANCLAAMSIDAFDGSVEPLNYLIHAVRPHAGQQEAARQILNWLSGSEIAAQNKAHVQDPYSFRCAPQVHGASYDAYVHVAKIVEVEINSATDNPLIFPEEDQIISGGNFHGQPLALGADYLALAIAELGSISERRTYQLLHGLRGLPEFLSASNGLHSGLMIPQYVAASLVNKNKTLCSPASVDSIPSSNGQEDHVSMGATAAWRLLEMNQNLRQILAVELLTAAQALDYRKPLKSSAKIEKLVQDYRKEVDTLTEDRILHIDMAKSVHFLLTCDVTSYKTLNYPEH